MLYTYIVKIEDPQQGHLDSMGAKKYKIAFTDRTENEREAMNMKLMETIDLFRSDLKPTTKLTITVRDENGERVKKAVSENGFKQ